jgi:tetratricopeptide (TPR) repeat protein
MTEEKKKITIILTVDDIYSIAYCNDMVGYKTVISYIINLVRNYLKKDDNWDAKICLAFLYMKRDKNSLGSKCVLEALSILEEGCKRNIGMAFNILGWYYKRRGYNNQKEEDYNTSIELLTKACEMEIEDAFVNLGNIYIDRCYPHRDENKAIELFIRGCALNYSRAFERLAYVYRYGDVVRDDPNEALELYKKAMKLGDFTAFFEIINCHKNYVDINDIAEFAYKKNLVSLKIYNNEYNINYMKALCTIHEKNMQIAELKQLMLMNVSKGKGDLIIAETAQYLV